MQPMVKKDPLVMSMGDFMNCAVDVEILGKMVT